MNYVFKNILIFALLLSIKGKAHEFFKINTGTIINDKTFYYNRLSSVSDTVPHNFIKYGTKGFELSDRTGNYLMQIEWRGQFRAAYPFDNNPVTNIDFENEAIHFGINRARIKVGGHSIKPWFKYYLEYELYASNLLDFRMMYEKYPWLKIKVGQWKVQYNRERIISSGKQQTMDRSILTRTFTIDRQQGISIFGNLTNGGKLNFSYWFSAFTGTGRGNDMPEDNHLMYMTRLQWNPTGNPLKFSGSDIENHSKLKMLFAIAGVTNQSAYTKFSQDGGGQLEGFDEGVPGQYRVNQAMQESAGKVKGFSWQQELHYKHIYDNVNTTNTEMIGNLSQIGYFLNSGFHKFPENVELYIRQAFIFPDMNNFNEKQDEYSMGINWFLSGHRNKFTIETSFIKSTFESNETHDGWRYRIQWDVSF